ncbi:CRISPR-associated protein Cas6 [Thermaerobacter marianensis DSM 12885]|uniref:CRISPR-associated protein Cas6 n=1 Tax=Thermaerobacter marianensis (strain ATCC 700841 / DSM 12885 / JCM 10246 / 7p75a) TaxID=644966 RepID=E6SGU1_THEM7|nr:CRISPR-associated endoribonuclease Cas6 [Thermaerobacter marianensis]ADU51675.1 CRISPR-associated protein Cas6 [Thermaerobacter marianensis DSM 12885]
MRAIFELRPASRQLVLPLQYNSMLQGLVYHLLEGTEVAEFLHDQGFTRGARRYKMFTFSRLEGVYTIERAHAAAGWTTTARAGTSGAAAAAAPTQADPADEPAGGRAAVAAAAAGGFDNRRAVNARDGKIIRFTGSVRFTLSSPYAPVIHAASSRALQLGALRLGTQVVEVEAVRFEELPPVTPPVTLRARTPITVYSTVNRPDGSRFTYFFEPRSGEFERLVAENLVRKWEAFTGRTYEGPGVRIRWRGPARGHVARFRHGVIKGFTGQFVIDGDPVLIALGLEAGFGSKNAQGFGLCDPIPTREGERGTGASRRTEPGPVVPAGPGGLKEAADGRAAAGGTVPGATAAREVEVGAD